MLGNSEKGPVAPSYDFELGIDGFWFSDLFDAGRLEQLTEAFSSYLSDREPVVAAAYTKYVENGGIGYEPKVASKVDTTTAKRPAPRSPSSCIRTRSSAAR